MRGINKILLENILPAHVAEHYLLRGQGMSGILQDNVIIQKKGLKLLSKIMIFFAGLLQRKIRKYCGHVCFHTKLQRIL